MPGKNRMGGMEIWKATFPLRMTFSHNLASRSEAETLIVILTDEKGNEGHGQILPRGYLTGETLESAQDALQALWWPAVSSFDMESAPTYEDALALLNPVFKKADSLRENAAYAGMDVALFSLMAAGRADFARSALPEPFPLVGTIPAVSPDKAAWLARIFRWLGYRRFKVKVTREAEQDAKRVAAVRSGAGRGAWIVADANAAWDYDEAVSRMRSLARHGISVVEEPLQRESALQTDFRRLEEATGVSVMADESVVTLKDAENLLARGTPAWWNLRLAKNGGVSGVSALASLAHSHGVKVYGGVLVGETGALAAAGRYVFPKIGAECGEYGFPRVFLQGDPFRGSPAGYFGRYAKKWNWNAISLDRKMLAMRGKLLHKSENARNTGT